MNVRKIRLEKGLSVPELSKLSGVPIRTIEDLEKRDDCKLSTATKIVKALEVNIEDLIK